MFQDFCSYQSYQHSRFALPSFNVFHMIHSFALLLHTFHPWQISRCLYECVVTGKALQILMRLDCTEEVSHFLCQISSASVIGDRCLTGAAELPYTVIHIWLKLIYIHTACNPLMVWTHVHCGPGISLGFGVVLKSCRRFHNPQASPTSTLSHATACAGAAIMLFKGNDRDTYSVDMPRG